MVRQVMGPFLHDYDGAVRDGCGSGMVRGRVYINSHLHLPARNRSIGAPKNGTGLFLLAGFHSFLPFLSAGVLVGLLKRRQVVSLDVDDRVAGCNACKHARTVLHYNLEGKQGHISR